MKSGVLKCTKRQDFIFEIEYRNAVLSRGTLIHKRGYGSCAQENLQKPCEAILPLKKGTYCEIHCLTRSVRVLVRNVWKECPEYPDVYPESPGYCYRSAKLTGPEYPDIYPEFPGTPLPTASFWLRGYKYPPYPLISLSLAHFRSELPISKREPSHFPFSPFLSDFLRGLK
jgi:hypothetical protein